MSDWQPIETAPKDGTMVLLGYLDKDGTFGVRGGKWFLVHPRNADKEWSHAWVCPIGKHLLDSRATHWAYMPDAPAPN